MEMIKKKRYEHADVGTKIIYEVYKEDGGNLSKPQMMNVLKDFFTGLIELIVKDNLWFSMPFGLGVIRIQEKEVYSKLVDGELVHNMRMDFNATNQLWRNDPEAKKEGRRIYHLNEHTDGKAYKIKWERGLSRNLKTRHSYAFYWGYLFKPNKEMKFLLTKTLKDPNKTVKYFK